MPLQPALVSNAQPALQEAGHQPALLAANRQPALVSLSQPALQGYVFDGSAFDPLSLSPVAWYKPETLAALADAAPVTAWPDSSGNGRNLAQANAALQPIMVEAGRNGRDIVRFGSVNADSLQSGAFALNQVEHLFAVLIWRAGSLDNQFAIDGNAIVGMSLLQPPATTRADINAGVSLVGPAGTNAWHQYACLFNGAASAIRQDGGAAVVGNAGANNAGGITLGAAGDGASAYAQCDIAEVLVFASALSDPDRIEVETYLRDRWATP